MTDRPLRDPLAASRALREVNARVAAMEPRLNGTDLRVLLALIALILSWQRLADRLTVKQIADAARLTGRGRRPQDQARTSMNRLEAEGIIWFPEGRAGGRGKPSLIAFVALPEDAGNTPPLVGGFEDGNTPPPGGVFAPEKHSPSRGQNTPPPVVETLPPQGESPERDVPREGSERDSSAASVYNYPKVVGEPDVEAADEHRQEKTEEDPNTGTEDEPSVTSVSVPEPPPELVAALAALRPEAASAIRDTAVSAAAGAWTVGAVTAAVRGVAGSNGQGLTAADTRRLFERLLFTAEGETP